MESQVWGVFLDISAAFDKIWHEGLIVKLNQNSISGNLLKLLCEFLSGQKQQERVVLNGQHSSWDNTTDNTTTAKLLKSRAKCNNQLGFPMKNDI